MALISIAHFACTIHYTDTHGGSDIVVCHKKSMAVKIADGLPRTTLCIIFEGWSITNKELGS